MDPLKLSDLNAIKDWDSFQPDMKGYLPPQPLAIWPDCGSIQDQIQQYAKTGFLRDLNDTPFIAVSVENRAPLVRLKIRGKHFAVPISPGDMAFLATHLGDGRASRHTVSEAELLNDAAEAVIWRNCTTVLQEIKASERNVTLERRLTTLDVLKSGSHALMTAAKDNNHSASIFVILATFTQSVDIRVHATHLGESCDVNLPSDLSQSFSVIGMYTGVSDARIDIGPGNEAICLTYHVSGVSDTYNTDLSLLPRLVSRLEHLSGAMPPLRDAFCAWRHAVNAGGDAPELILFFLDGCPESAGAFTGKDATLLCHLAPLAKAYGFKLYLCEIVHTMSSTQQVMEYDAEAEYEWNKLRTLGGIPVTQPPLLDLATDMLQTDLHGDLMCVHREEEHEVADESIHNFTMVLRHG
ncbi:hypothetical protein DFH06DRAFT_1371813 [Mycena polygramma]|nr:hypothetical protein DFH06DRAFT_1371813 [Mycena polygramma]